MKHKIITYMFLSVFLFSIIGVPISLHYCEMMKQKTISLCDICADEMSNVKSSCFEDEQNIYRETISLPNSNCCQDEFVINKVEDEFIFNKSDAIFFSSIEKLFQPITLISPSIDFSLQESFYCDSSPPFLINPEINITNSILLI